MTTSTQLEDQLRRWSDAGILDADTAARIRAYEASRETPGRRWPVVFAVAFGAIMVAAGVLLFVAAHWDSLSPTERFLLVQAMVAGFHLAAGALTERMPALDIALHGVGTVALGAGIFLSGQIFNLQEHWPGGILLWAIGAVLTWFVLRDWVQASLAAILIPAWIASEWYLRAERFTGSDRFLIEFITMLAITYLSARPSAQDSSFRRALGWIGGLALIPASVVLAVAAGDWAGYHHMNLPLSVYVSGTLLALVLPLLAAYFLRGKSLGWNVAYAAWVFAVPFFNHGGAAGQIITFVLCSAASAGLVMWGLQEQRRERINLGVAGFAITIIVFYFSNVMDKLGRSFSLVVFGILFLVGGWQLEQLRRKLVARTAAGGTR